MPPYGVFLDTRTQIVKESRPEVQCKYFFSNCNDFMYLAKYSLATPELYRRLTVSLKGECEEYHFTSKNSPDIWRAKPLKKDDRR